MVGMVNEQGRKLRRLSPNNGKCVLRQVAGFKATGMLGNSGGFHNPSALLLHPTSISLDSSLSTGALARLIIFLHTVTSDDAFSLAARSPGTVLPTSG